MYLVQDDPSSGIPWGRPPAPALPVPPFADRQAASTFVANLSGFIALLGSDKGGDDAVGPTTFALLTVVQRDLDILRSAATFDPPPSPQVLTLAMVTYFPAPWTAAGLNEVIGQVLTRDNPPRHVLPGKVSWGFDPRFTAARGAAGDWEVTASERGTDRLVGRFADENDLVLCRMSFARSHPMPFGWSWDDSNMTALDGAAAATRGAWATHAQLPYLEIWRS